MNNARFLVAIFLHRGVCALASCILYRTQTPKLFLGVLCTSALVFGRVVVCLAMVTLHDRDDSDLSARWIACLEYLMRVLSDRC